TTCPTTLARFIRWRGLPRRSTSRASSSVITAACAISIPAASSHSAPNWISLRRTTATVWPRRPEWGDGGLPIPSLLRDRLGSEQPRGRDRFFRSRNREVLQDRCPSRFRARRRNGAVSGGMAQTGLYVLDSFVWFRIFHDYKRSWTRRRGGLTVHTRYRAELTDPVAQTYDECLTFTVDDRGKEVVINGRVPVKVFFPQEFLSLIEL